MEPEESRESGRDEEERRVSAALAGHRGDAALARRHLGDPSASVRVAALGALVRLGAVGSEDIAMARRDEAAAVRRALCELAAKLPPTDFSALLTDRDAAVVEAACFAIGEQGDHRALDGVIAVASGHPDALCREAAVAALGSLGDDAGREAVIAALDGAPPIRRRAVIALAAFDGGEVEAALAAHRDDRDWQVRQAVEDVLGPNDEPGPVSSGPPPGHGDSAPRP